MREHGYEERITSGDELAFRQALFARDDAAGIVHRYDVHWAITNTALFADVLRFDELRARSVPLPRIGEHARTISDVDALLYACVHRVAHHHDSDRLIWLADIHLLRERMRGGQALLPVPRSDRQECLSSTAGPDDEGAFWHLAAERGVVGVCLRSIERAQEWFGGPPHRAAEFLDAATLARDEPTRTYLDRRRRGALFLADLGALPGWRARARRFRQLAFPPPAFMRERFHTHSSLALPWLYAYRAARGVARLFRRVS